MFRSIFSAFIISLTIFLYAPSPASAVQTCDCNVQITGPQCNVSMEKSFPIGSSITVRQIAEQVPRSDCPLITAAEAMEALGVVPRQAAEALNDSYVLTPETCGSVPGGAIAIPADVPLFGGLTYSYEITCSVAGTPDPASGSAGGAASPPAPAGGRTSVGNEDTSLVRLINPLGGNEENPTGRVNLVFILGGVVKFVSLIIGSLVLVVFVYGGFLFLTSAGNADQVKKGMHTMLYSVLGLFVIFGSYAILSTIITGLKARGSTVAFESCEDVSPAFQCVDVSSCKGIRETGSTQDKIDDCRSKPADVCLVNLCTALQDDKIVCCEPK